MTRRAPADLNIVASFYARWSPHEDKRREIADDHKLMFAEAKSEGLNPKALRKAFAEQYRVENQTSEQAEKRNETDDDVELYLSALARVREDEPEHDAETGEVKEPETTNGGDHETSERDPVILQRRLLDVNIAEQGTPANDVEVRTRPANAVEEPGRSLASTNTPTESVEAISVPISEQQTAMSAQTGAVEALVDQSTAARTDVPRPPITAVTARDSEAGTQAPPVAPIAEQQPRDGNARPVAVQGAADVATSDPLRSDAANGNEAAAAPDHSQPNPICRDPGDCGVYASWHLPCESCKRAAAERRAA